MHYLEMTRFAVTVLLTLPWLNPFSPGPTPVVAALVFSWLCAAMVLVLSGVAHGRGFDGDYSRFGGRDVAKPVAMAWLLAALLSAVIGLLQYFGVASALAPWVNAPATLGEAFANLRQRNQFATLTHIGLAALVWWAAEFSPTDKRNASGRNALALLASALLASGAAASSSRTGLLQLLLLMVMAGFWHSTRSGVSVGAPQGDRAAVPRILLVAGLAYALASWALPRLGGLDPQASGIWARLHDGDPVCSSRLTLWSNVLHLINQKPWFGWGWGELDYAHFITLYPGARFCDILDNAHNLPLHLAVTLGVPLALGLCLLCAWWVWRAKPWQETDATRQLAWTVLALIGLHSLLEYPLWYGPFQIAALLCVALLLKVKRPPARVFIAQAAIFLIVVCVYTGWDYWRISQIYLSPAQRAPAYREDTLHKLQPSWLFKNQVRFAELTTTPLTADNAAPMYELAQELLHFSPEPRVAQILFDSAVLLGREADARYYQERFRAAFPALPEPQIKR